MSNVISPKIWKASEKEIKNGWLHSPAFLLEMVDNLALYENFDDTDDMMEYLDVFLKIFEEKYNIYEK
jgi:hypothetical protein